MNGVVIAVITVLLLLLAAGIDKWLYSEEKPHIAWRLIPVAIYLGAALYLYLRFGFNAF